MFCILHDPKTPTTRNPVILENMVCISCETSNGMKVIHKPLAMVLCKVFDDFATVDDFFSIYLRFAMASSVLDPLEPRHFILESCKKCFADLFKRSSSDPSTDNISLVYCMHNETVSVRTLCMILHSFCMLMLLYGVNYLRSNIHLNLCMLFFRKITKSCTVEDRLLRFTSPTASPRPFIWVHPPFFV